MKQGILVKSKEWAKHLRPFNKRRQWRAERKAEAPEIEREYDDLINGAEVVFDDQGDCVYEQDAHLPYPHLN